MRLGRPRDVVRATLDGRAAPRSSSRFGRPWYPLSARSAIQNRPRLLPETGHGLRFALRNARPTSARSSRHTWRMTLHRSLSSSWTTLCVLRTCMRDARQAFAPATPGLCGPPGSARGRYGYLAQAQRMVLDRGGLYGLPGDAPLYRWLKNAVLWVEKRFGQGVQRCAKTASRAMKRGPIDVIRRSALFRVTTRFPRTRTSLGVTFG